jgi:hypothetical protein
MNLVIPGDNKIQNWKNLDYGGRDLVAGWVNDHHNHFLGTRLAYVSQVL